MALAYQEPGVTVDEIVTQQISPLLAASALVCLVGLAQGYQTRTDQFVLSGTTAVLLPGLPAGAKVAAVSAVKDALNPNKGASDGSGYTATTDYTVSVANGTITRVGTGSIPDNTLVNVTYTYIPSNYYEPIRLYDQGSVETRFGPAYDSTGTAVNSPLSLAASIAFENGADSVVCQPLFTRATPGDPTTAPTQPTTTSQASQSTWQDTLYVLRDIEDINVIIPIVGQSMTNVGDAQLLTIFSTVQDHLYFMAQQDQYIIAVQGEDASASTAVATAATIRAHANTLRSRYAGALAEQTVLLNTARYVRSVPAFNRTAVLGAQYAAAGIAGMLAANPVSSTLTRKLLSGFVKIDDPRDSNDRTADASAGLLVLVNKSGNIIVRHAITLDNTTAARRELSVVRAKHRMIESVRDTIDRQIIGQIIADGNAEGTVRSTVIGVLEQLRQDRDLVDYSAVQAKLVSLEPTTIQVRFSYRPALPINYVAVQFSLDLSAGTVTSTDPTLASL